MLNPVAVDGPISYAQRLNLDLSTASPLTT